MQELGYEAYTVGIVCALEFEISAVRYMLDKEHARLPRKPGDSNLYILGELSGHNVILASLPGSQGKSAAAIVARDIARTFPSIELRLMVGIGGGVPSRKNDIRLGDVVKSDELRISYQRPLEADELFRSEYRHVPNKATCQLCDRTKLVHRQAREPIPKIYYGLIASGDQVIRSASNAAEIDERVSGDIMCFEMEAAGIATEYSCIAIQGVSDYADSHKNDTWQHYAAGVAAGCAKELLSYVDPPQPTITKPHGRHGPETSISDRPAAIPAKSIFRGQGVQNSGYGNISVGRNLNIGNDYQ
ncbi:hypothetical protein N7507_003744 [Penicillium longicatenatum]|nr:hypothetical protein N7507_003744 [Penicillium longicatenatum]